MAASGCFTSWAIEAVSSPSIEIRAARASSARIPSSAASAATRAERSMTPTSSVPLFIVSGGKQAVNRAGNSRPSMARSRVSAA